jgi:hypothetical protein
MVGVTGSIPVAPTIFTSKIKPRRAARARAVTIETRQPDRETDPRVFARAALDLLAAVLREAPHT